MRAEAEASLAVAKVKYRLRVPPLLLPQSQDGFCLLNTDYNFLPSPSPL